jgi:hypothetical protein
MSRNEIEAAVKDLTNLVLQGQLMEAFEKYYDDQVVMQENDLPAVISKEENRKRELDFLSKLTEFRGAEVKGITVADNIAAIIWHFDYTHEEWGSRKFTEVAVQEWKNGKIVWEKFVYNN